MGAASSHPECFATTLSYDADGAVSRRLHSVKPKECSVRSTATYTDPALCFSNSEPTAKRARLHLQNPQSGSETQDQAEHCKKLCSAKECSSTSADVKETKVKDGIPAECADPSFSEKPAAEEMKMKERMNRNIKALIQEYLGYTLSDREKLSDLALKLTDTQGTESSSSRLHALREFSNAFSESGANDVSCTEQSLSYASKLMDFAKVIEEAVRYGEAIQLGSLISCSPIRSTVSCLEFSPADNTLLAVADISRTIHVFDIDSFFEENISAHYPIAKMECDTKISCVTWNTFIAPVLVNSGYDGSVSVWDVNKAKIWSLNMANSVMTIRPHFVVCAVNFGFKQNELAVGCADRSVYVYDLRQPKLPVNLFTGHRQAVSYVRFLNPKEIVSASTDNTLRLWNTHSQECTQVFSGHKNAKNFVGLSSRCDHILTGSEDNRSYVYYKGVCHPVVCYDMESRESLVLGTTSNSSAIEDDSEIFVSAVAWRPETDEVVVGNSAGKIELLKLC